MNIIKHLLFGGMIYDTNSLLIHFTSEINNIIYKMDIGKKHEIKILDELLFVSYDEITKLLDIDFIIKNNIKIEINDNTIFITRSKYKKNILKNIYGTCWLISILSILYNSDFIDEINENNNHNTNQLPSFIPNNKNHLIKPLIKFLIEHRKNSCKYISINERLWLNNNNYQTCSNNLSDILDILSQIYNYEKIDGGDDDITFFVINILFLFYYGKCISIFKIKFNQKDLIIEQLKKNTLVGTIINSYNNNNGHSTSLYKRNGDMYAFNNGLETNFNYEHFFDSYDCNGLYKINKKGIPIISNVDNQELIAEEILFFNLCDLSDDFFNSNTISFLNRYFNGCNFDINFSLEYVNEYVNANFYDILLSERKVDKLISLCDKYNIDLSNIKYYLNDEYESCYNFIIKLMANVKKRDYFNDLLVSNEHEIIKYTVLLIENKNYVKNVLKLLLKYRNVKIINLVETNIIYYIFQIYCKLYDENIDYANMFVRSFYKSLNLFKNKYTQFVTSNEYNEYINMIRNNQKHKINVEFLKLVDGIIEDDIFINNFNDNN
jgi:hypothetical protein